MTMIAAIMIATTLQILMKTTVGFTSTGGCINQMEGSGDCDANRQGG